MRVLLGLVLVLTVVGCRGKHDLFPMETGKKWTYAVSAGFLNTTAEVRVTRQTGVAGVEGYVLSGPMGESRVAWKNDVLVAERLINARFEPALPMLVDSDQKVRRTWRGKVMGLWGLADATAVLEQGPGEEQIGGRTIKVTKSFLTLTMPKSTIRLQTMFQPGAGIATQRQWTDGNSVLQLERLSG